MPASARCAFDPTSARQVALRVHIDQQNLPTGERERRREVDGGRGFAHATFLIGDSNHSGCEGCRLWLCFGHVAKSLLLVGFYTLVPNR